ncbi:MAG: DUF2384 domain-containing protein [Halieaceae bacterium]|nr:DUF2384 domain-containing protein [Halieaceae bacterium]MCP5148928.1 DUF2384 domain-containing protein [Pseudomonadales bacterium]MCP5165861.1 DUF2384 domain-containing protein [Pseudomonadales bacterium]MCP5188717.1 DUF2384 domain-containing protein [Pseudomonadales bacterium]MCP5195039.1 DUF2384 domain-containing protein [Pseudomonadales bacterium]
MEIAPAADRSQVLAKSAYAAGEYLGLNRTEVGEVVGRTRSSIDRNGIDPQTKSGQLALLMVRIYRSLYALMGGDKDNMRHFMHTPNHGTGGVPAEQLRDVEGLVRVCHYLDAIRGRG